MRVTAEALGPKSASSLLVAGAEEVMIPCVGRFEDALSRAARVEGPVTLHVPANRIQNLGETACSIREHGIDRVLAVSGNPGEGVRRHGTCELVEALDRAGLHVSVGAYPENWFTTPGSRRRRRRSTAVLAEKEAAGARRIITQAAFHASSVMRWFEAIRAGGVRLPVSVGVMPNLPAPRIARIVRHGLCQARSRGRHGINCPDADLLVRVLRSAVSRPERFVEAIGRVGVLGPEDRFHVFAQGSAVDDLLRTCHTATGSVDTVKWDREIVADESG